MFRSIIDKIKRDTDYPDRTYTLGVFARVRDGALYDHLPYGFHMETNAANEHIPLRDRRPSVKHNLCRLVVDEATALLFSESHFPVANCEDEATTENLMALMKECQLNKLMLETASHGSAGSAAIHMRVLQQADGKTHRVFFDAHETGFLTPQFDPCQPDTLIGVRQRYKVRGAELKGMGYPVPDKNINTIYWFCRKWDASAETWFAPVMATPVSPQEIAAAENPPVDDERTIVHNLGFVPWVWIRNLPGKLRLIAADNGVVAYSDIDGACTFDAAIETMIEIDYQLSQAGRGLKYSMDPLLLIKEPPQNSGDFVRSPANALVMDTTGSAELVEIRGSAFTVVLEYVKTLREFALESIHGNRSDPSKLAAAQSGRAMELMNQATIWLADKMRISYGEGALLSLLKMTVKANEKFPLLIGGKSLQARPDLDIKLVWPPWYPPSQMDKAAQAQCLKTLGDSGHISRQTAIAALANDYDIEDVAAELARIEADRKAEYALLPAAKTAISLSQSG